MTKADKINEKKPSIEDTDGKNDHDVNSDEKVLDKQDAIEEKLKNTEDKLLRTLAEMENQRRRFEKEKQEAFEYGGFNLARETLSLLDNIDRAINSFQNAVPGELPSG